MVSSRPVNVLPLVTCFCPWSAKALPHHTVRGSGEPIFQRRLDAATADIAASPSSPSQRWYYGSAWLADPISQSLLLMPWPRPRWSSGSWCHRPICGGGRRPACEPAPRAPSLRRAAWPPPSPSSREVTCARYGSASRWPLHRGRFEPSGRLPC
jgi:hypothetical protein